MRTLFASERRCVLNLFRTEWKRKMSSVPTVVTETVAEPVDRTKKPWFNCDFILDFVDWRTCKSDRSAAVCSVLPNALGAELFLVVEKATLSPTALELNGGAAFPIKHYARYVRIVEEAIHEHMERLDHREGEYLRKIMAEALSIGTSAFARVLVVNGDITFLYFPSDTKPVMRGQPINLVSGDNQYIDCYTDAGQVVCFDGWVRTNVVHGEHTLVASPVVHE